MGIKLKKQARMSKRIHLPLKERNIYHGRNWIPMTRYGFGEDEADSDYSWIILFSKQRLEDISDINDGEKNMMNLWNMHLKKYYGGGVSHLGRILSDFVADFTRVIYDNNLYRNFVCHITVLHQAGFISMEIMTEIIISMQSAMKALLDSNMKMSTIIKGQWKRSVENMVHQILEESVMEKVAGSFSSTSRTGSQKEMRSNNFKHCEILARPSFDLIQQQRSSIFGQDTSVISKAQKNSYVISSASELACAISVVSDDTNCVEHEKSIKYSYGSGRCENELGTTIPVDENPYRKKVEALPNIDHVRFCDDLSTVQIMSLPMYLNHICKCPTD